MEPKKVIALFVVVAVVAVAFGFGYMWFQSEKQPDGHFNFSGRTADSYTAVIEGIEIDIHAPDGKMFYITDVVLKNDDYDRGLNTAELVWKVTIDKMTFSMDLRATQTYKGFTSMTFEKGKLWGYSVIFTIPSTISMQDISLSYTYLSTEKSPVLKFDPELKLPGPKNAIVEIAAVASRSGA